MLGIVVSNFYSQFTLVLLRDIDAYLRKKKAVLVKLKHLSVSKMSSIDTICYTEVNATEPYFIHGINITVLNWYVSVPMVRFNHMHIRSGTCHITMIYPIPYEIHSLLISKVKSPPSPSCITLARKR